MSLCKRDLLWLTVIINKVFLRTFLEPLISVLPSVGTLACCTLSRCRVLSFGGACSHFPCSHISSVWTDAHNENALFINHRSSWVAWWHCCCEDVLIIIDEVSIYHELILLNAQTWVMGRWETRSSVCLWFPSLAHPLLCVLWTLYCILSVVLGGGY